jgi:hypothetical protein
MWYEIINYCITLRMIVICLLQNMNFKFLVSHARKFLMQKKHNLLHECGLPGSDTVYSGHDPFDQSTLSHTLKSASLLCYKYVLHYIRFACVVILHVTYRIGFNGKLKNLTFLCLYVAVQPHA